MWPSCSQAGVSFVAARCSAFNGGTLTPPPELSRLSELPGGEHRIGPPKTKAGQRSVAIPHHLLQDIEDHLKGIDQDAEAWLFPGENGLPVSTRTVNRIWSKTRLTIGRPDLHFHDLRHSGLTWAATTGASLAELKVRRRHSATSTPPPIGTRRWLMLCPRWRPMPASFRCTPLNL